MKILVALLFVTLSLSGLGCPGPQNAPRQQGTSETTGVAPEKQQTDPQGAIMDMDFESGDLPKTSPSGAPDASEERDETAGPD